MECDLRLRAWRVELADANDFVREVHRHHAPEQGHRFSLGVGDTKLRGVAICGRPKARGLSQRDVLEVTRVATDGARNACSWLYSAAGRIAEEMGFRVVVTYTLVSESGASLRACGWWPEELGANSGDWNFMGRGGQQTMLLEPKAPQSLGPKVRWIWFTGNEWVAPAAPVE